MDRQPPWTPADPVGEALHFLRMSGTYYTRSELTAPWGMVIPAVPGALWFHVVTAGEGALETAQGGTVLRARDLVLVPHGAAMSRSAFAARFTELVGEPAMQYVTRWRMHVALDGLRDGENTVAEMAGRLGYRSEAAFSRAFKRVVGVAPGSVRR
ncbi:MAG: AraC family transcriptional regulator [Pseudonocardia sp.]|uniref:AraC family transcriptional regulator n=1 Tax=Pseudonocardia sp. TaxID=60912 RepID=UPI001AD0704C|nr:AraC family transcriptional regulator [Pseudonocardia sp.]MBN9097206.1 AraC family transcriptional regulator [Pseudonocardia sp.]